MDLAKIKSEIADEWDMPDWVRNTVADLVQEVERLRKADLNNREMIQAGGDRARRLEGANTKLTSDAKWLFGEFGWEHWRECDIPREEDGGCGYCTALEEMRPEYGD